MMNFFKMYLKERMKYILLTVMLIGLFSFTLLLMNVPAKALLYPVLLCLFLGLLVLVTDCAIAKSRKNERANLDKITLSVIDSMPEAHSEEVRDYQNAIRQLGNEYRNYVSESERKYENMMDYYTVWAHQIKTPISSMKLAFQGEDSTLSRRLSVDLFRIEQYVDMVLQYARLDSEANDLVIAEYALDPILRASVRKFAPQFVAKRLALNYDGTDLTVITDKKWLSVIIDQLLSNAIKYTPSGAVGITVESSGLLCISDTGIGIAPQDLPRIFERGYTGENGRLEKRSSGLGLYLCRRICRNLGHTITAESRPGEGTTVRIKLEEKKITLE